MASIDLHALSLAAKKGMRNPVREVYDSEAVNSGEYVLLIPASAMEGSTQYVFLKATDFRLHHAKTRIRPRPILHREPPYLWPLMPHFLAISSLDSRQRAHCPRKLPRNQRVGLEDRHFVPWSFLRWLALASFVITGRFVASSFGTGR